MDIYWLLVVSVVGAAIVGYFMFQDRNRTTKRSH